MKELDYNEHSKNVLEKIKDEKNIVLATSADGRVTTRIVGQLLFNGMIMFTTDSKSFKVSQIKENSNVAFHLNGINIESVATLIGHPDTVPLYNEEYERKYPEYVSKYESFPDDVVVASKIKRADMYVFDETAGKIVIDFEAEKAYRVDL